jgi:aspartyl-tRNA(Asn)/glutamyl-tRNA(Gln) amidotransferase subunit C
MTKKLDRATVLHVAKLASLHLSDEEADRFTEELARVVAYVGELEAVDTTGVEPTAEVQLTRSAWRADEPRPGLRHEEALAAAPRVEGDGFAVPVFVE